MDLWVFSFSLFILSTGSLFSSLQILYRGYLEKPHNIPGRRFAIMHKTTIPLPPISKRSPNLCAKVMLHKSSRCCYSLECVVLGVNASAGSVLGDAIFVVDVMTIAGLEERVLGPFGIVEEFPFHEVFVE